jgi:hypothetical protein
MSRLSHTDRASGVVVRYQRQRPGELVHLDVKKLGRIPNGGGHRIHGRATTRRGLGIGAETAAGWGSSCGARAAIALNQRQGGAVQQDHAGG